MGENIPIIQRERCKCADGSKCGNSGRCRHNAIVVIWTGIDANQIRDTASTIGKEAHQYVRWVVTRANREATFTSLKDRDRNDAGICHDD